MLADKATEELGVPAEVRQAMLRDWGVYVDAYLTDGARVGNRYAATAYFAEPGPIPNGTTVATHPLRHLATQGAFKLLQTLNQADHYVLVSEQTLGSHDGERG